MGFSISKLCPSSPPVYLTMDSKYEGQPIHAIDTVQYAALANREVQKQCFAKIERNHAIFVLSEGEQILTHSIAPDGKSATITLLQPDRPPISARTSIAPHPGYWF